MYRIGLLTWAFMLTLAACGPAAQASRSPQRLPTATTLVTTLVLSPAQVATPTAQPGATAVATPQIEGPFSAVSYSTDIFHLRCDPLAIIFDITVSDPNVHAVSYFFRMKDKASGMMSKWSNGEDMKNPGNGNFEFIMSVADIPDEARFREAWLQYQFVATNKARQVIGRSQIFGDQITFTIACP
jgi:hypothetical protein